VEGGKRYVTALLLRSGGIRPGDSDSTGCMRRGRGTGGKLPSHCVLTRGDQGGCDIDNDRRMMGTGSNGGWEVGYDGTLTATGPI